MGFIKRLLGMEVEHDFAEKMLRMRNASSPKPSPPASRIEKPDWCSDSLAAYYDRLLLDSLYPDLKPLENTDELTRG